MSQTLFTPKDIGSQSSPPVEAIGGKAYGLYWLANNRFPVPLTWVLSTTAFDLVIDAIGLVEALAEIEQTVAGLPKDWSAAQQQMDEIEPQRVAMVQALKQVEATGHLSASLARLPETYRFWAVRSSATVEDNPRYSFAGQFRSLLFVPTEELWEAVCQVWASAFNREALMYCAQSKMPLPHMAVILQPMTPITTQDRSGVAFSHSFVPTLPGVLIQTTFGGGQVVVDGYGGDLFGVEGTKVEVLPMSPDHIVITGQDGGMVAKAVPPGLALTEKEAQELASLVCDVAKRWGGAVNIEFIWRAGKQPLLVQVRSITTL